MDYGFTVRFRDYEEMLAYQPRMLEFHFTDQDLDEHYPGGDHSAGSEQPLSWWCMPPSSGTARWWTCAPWMSASAVPRAMLMQKSINLTREMAPYFVGTPKVIIHPGAMSLDHPITNKQALYDNLRRSVNELDYAGVELLLENLPPHPWYFGGQWLTNAFMDAYEIRDFIASHGPEFVL